MKSGHRSKSHRFKLEKTYFSSQTGHRGEFKYKKMIWHGKMWKKYTHTENLYLRGNSGHWVSSTNAEGEMNRALEDEPLWRTLRV